MLILDGVYIGSVHGSPARFRWVKAPSGDELTQLTHTIAQRVARYLERQVSQAIERLPPEPGQPLNIN